MERGIYLLVVVQHKLRDVHLVRIDGVVQELYSSEVVDSVLHLAGREGQKPPGVELGGEAEKLGEGIQKSPP